MLFTIVTSTAYQRTDAFALNTTPREVASGRWAKVEPGCEIIVPERPEREPLNMQGILGNSPGAKQWILYKKYRDIQKRY